MGDFGEADLRKVAELARLRLTEAEVSTFARQLGQVLGYVEKLNRLDTSEIEPLLHPHEMATPLREDEVVASLGAELILSSAPEHLHDGFKVPQVIGGPS